MLPSETMIWQPEFTDKTLSRKPGAVQTDIDGEDAFIRIGSIAMVRVPLDAMEPVEADDE
ncbi:hypothetical protein VEGS09_38370 [Escherichia coli]|nr:hypothetical protein VEGS09_38370 [Escherichia coli]BEC11651.1 hypothetical protein VEE66_38210 [Escherichia coli]